MLERYFSKLSTLDRIRSSWLTPSIEAYVEQLTGEGYSRSSITRRVALLCRFAASHGAHRCDQGDRAQTGARLLLHSA
jgi:hypothetical protein